MVKAGRDINKSKRKTRARQDKTRQDKTRQDRYSLVHYRYKNKARKTSS